MRALAPLAVLLSALLAAAAPAPNPGPADRAAGVALQQLAALATTNLLVQTDSQTKTRKCDPRKAPVRREWGSLSCAERKAYTDAVLCLQKKSALTPLSFASGVRSRFDDFVATHINQTLTIHWTGNFLAWHRYFTWTYEKALQDECGYRGTQPYWDWGLYSNAPQNSPIFNGDAYSMSGSGTPIPHPGYTVNIPGVPPISFPAGIGGGCVTDGPFANMTVNLGPIGSLYLPPNGNGLSYNPRCLKRDVNPYVNSLWANFTNTLNLIVRNNDIASFQGVMQGDPAYPGSPSVHGGGHNTVGGDPGLDFFASPGDPVFFLHHSQIDRVWTIWQNLNLPERQNAILGTRTMFNNPPSLNTTLDDLVYLGYNNVPPRPIRELMSTIDGPFCYVYA